MLRREKTHWQWDKHLTCLVVLVSQVIINIIRGSKSTKSVVEHCGVADWILVGLYAAICITVSVIAIKRIIAE